MERRPRTRCETRTAIPIALRFKGAYVYSYVNFGLLVRGLCWRCVGRRSSYASSLDLSYRYSARHDTRAHPAHSKHRSIVRNSRRCTFPTSLIANRFAHDATAWCAPRTFSRTGRPPDRDRSGVSTRPQCPLDRTDGHSETHRRDTQLLHSGEEARVSRPLCAICVVLWNRNQGAGLRARGGG